MGLQEVMLARMKQSHGRPPPSSRRREQLPALPGTIRDAYALKQRPAGLARPSYNRRRGGGARGAAVDEREDTILKPRRASTWRERAAAPLRAAAPRTARRAEARPAAARRAAPRPARRQPVEPNGQPARLTAARWRRTSGSRARRRRRPARAASWRRRRGRASRHPASRPDRARPCRPSRNCPKAAKIGVPPNVSRTA